MVDTVNIVGATTAVTTNPQPVGAPASPVDSTVKFSADKATATGLSYTNRLYHDPISGLFINEQLDATTGRVISQTPRDSALAYLRNGLDNTSVAPQKSVTA